MPRIRDTKLFDFLVVSPLIAWYAAGIAGLVPHLAQEAALSWGRFDASAVLAAASKVATLAFLGLQIVLFAIRRLPKGKAGGFRPRLAALIGSNLQLAFLALPLATANASLTLLSATLVFLGMAGSIYAALWLGRSFSVFPQARGLVVHGPYRYVRHPLYLAEQIATFGAMLQFATPWAIVIALASFAAQFPRMHYEERILGETYPSYKTYAAGTARLIPHLY